MSGRQVLITGASRGLGLELVKQYATGGGSAIVFAACRQGAEAPALKALLRELQRELASDTAVVPVRLDVTCPASVAALSATLSQHDASLNVLWNNAGIAVGRECQVSNGTMDYDAWESCLATNVMGPTRVLETCLPHLDSKAFTVVNVSSGLGSISRVMGGGFDTLSQDIVYRSSKAALNMCTVCSAAELKAKFPASNAVVVAMARSFILSYHTTHD